MAGLRVFTASLLLLLAREATADGQKCESGADCGDGECCLDMISHYECSPLQKLGEVCNVMERAPGKEDLPYKAPEGGTAMCPCASGSCKDAKRRKRFTLGGLSLNRLKTAGFPSLSMKNLAAMKREGQAGPPKGICT